MLFWASREAWEANTRPTPPAERDFIGLAGVSTLLRGQVYADEVDVSVLINCIISRHATRQLSMAMQSSFALKAIDSDLRKGGRT